MRCFRVSPCDDRCNYQSSTVDLLFRVPDRRLQNLGLLAQDVPSRCCGWHIHTDGWHNRYPDTRPVCLCSKRTSLNEGIAVGAVACWSSGIPPMTRLLRVCWIIYAEYGRTIDTRGVAVSFVVPFLAILAIQPRVNIPLARRDVPAAGHGASGFHHRHVSLARQDRHFPSKLEIGVIWHFLSLKLYTHPSQGVSMILSFTASPPAAEGTSHTC